MSSSLGIQHCELEDTSNFVLWIATPSLRVQWTNQLCEFNFIGAPSVFLGCCSLQMCPCVVLPLLWFCGNLFLYLSFTALFFCILSSEAIYPFCQNVGLAPISVAKEVGGFCCQKPFREEEEGRLICFVASIHKLL